MLTPTLTALLMAFLALATGVLLAWPWLRRQAAPTPDRTAINVAIYRSRVAEVDAEAAAGILDPALVEQIKAEQADRLLEDAETETPIAPPRRAVVGWLLVAALPLAAAVWYLGEDRWTLAQRIELARQDPVEADRLAVEHGLAALEERVRLQPDESGSWAQLGQLYLSVDRTEDAVAAFARLTVLEPENPDAWAFEGEALARLQGQDLSGPPRARFEKALMLAPEHGKGLFYGGLAAAQAGELGLAEARWARLAERDDLPPALRRVVGEALAEWRGDDAVVAPAPSAPVGPEPSVRIPITVTLDPALASAVGPRSQLLIFIRAADGPPMPLAVRRLTALDFPQTVMLGEADVMTPDLTLSAFDRYEVVARLSTGGDVTARPGDLEGRLRIERAAALQGVQLTLDTRVADR